MFKYLIYILEKQDFFSNSAYDYPWVNDDNYILVIQLYLLYLFFFGGIKFYFMFYEKYYLYYSVSLKTYIEVLNGYIID